MKIESLELKEALTYSKYSLFLTIVPLPFTRVEFILRNTLVILILSLVSCNNKNGVEFIIHNESTETIDSVRISTIDKMATVKLVDIQKGLEKKDFLNMEDVIKTDGDYFVEISTPRSMKNKRIGYYTNGYPLDEKIDIYFLDDTIKYKAKIKEY